MTIRYILLLLLLLGLIIRSRYVHEKRTGDTYIDSYRWYVKILR